MTLSYSDAILRFENNRHIQEAWDYYCDIWRFNSKIPVRSACREY
ncbi:hypothetical protein SPLC1_S202570 [Arthrospira platensis C1]|uniref:Uncharacterized protein n=1 Tax=Limnospira indica PCC 8005 TaxID=376219 RepID=A0A9P1KLI4_9CYAN|nr:hypothetical protein SPLC1_S202570 [Arthrospira platensis C1]CDM98215.1 conserved protein of unknown function [Limnospira indica PCC 8005]